MDFIVSEKVKGSYILVTLNRAIGAGMRISIGGNDLYENDVKYAIKNEILIPIGKKYTKEMLETDANMFLVNKTKKVLIFGDLVLGPTSSLPLSKRERDSVDILTAEKNGLIEVVLNKKSKSVKKEIVDYVAPESGEDKKVEPVVWDFREKVIKEAEKVPQSEDIAKIDNDDEKIDFIDEKSKKKIKKKSKKKVAKKKKTTKKKETTKKSKKVNIIQPVGEKVNPKTDADAAIELDSRGNPIGGKPSDTLEHLIDLINAPEDVSFADQEQAQEKRDQKNNTV